MQMCFLIRYILDSSKTPVIAQRRIIVQNPDGTTKVILQNVVQSSQVFIEMGTDYADAMVKRRLTFSFISN